VKGNFLIENYGIDDFESEVAAGVEALQCMLEGWPQDCSLNYRLIDRTGGFG
jgi:hypothetical protein